MTTWLDDQGLVRFRPDVYGRDARALSTYTAS